MPSSGMGDGGPGEVDPVGGGEFDAVAPRQWTSAFWMRRRGIRATGLRSAGAETQSKAEAGGDYWSGASSGADASSSAGVEVSAGGGVEAGSGNSVESECSV